MHHSVHCNLSRMFTENCTSLTMTSICKQATSSFVRTHWLAEEISLAISFHKDTCIKWQLPRNIYVGLVSVFYSGSSPINDRFIQCIQVIAQECQILRIKSVHFIFKSSGDLCTQKLECYKYSKWIPYQNFQALSSHEWLVLSSAIVHCASQFQKSHLKVR